MRVVHGGAEPSVELRQDLTEQKLHEMDFNVYMFYDCMISRVCLSITSVGVGMVISTVDTELVFDAVEEKILVLSENSKWHFILYMNCIPKHTCFLAFRNDQTQSLT